MKHCESGRLCFSHQSPLALNPATSFAWHCAHSSSGTPCSSHHQLSCECSAAATAGFASAVCSAFFAWHAAIETIKADMAIHSQHLRKLIVTPLIMSNPLP